MSTTIAVIVTAAIAWLISWFAIGDAGEKAHKQGKSDAERELEEKRRLYWACSTIWRDTYDATLHAVHMKGHTGPKAVEEAALAADAAVMFKRKAFSEDG